MKTRKKGEYTLQSLFITGNIFRALDKGKTIIVFSKDVLQEYRERIKYMGVSVKVKMGRFRNK